MKDNKVIDYPIWGGHDRKASGGSNPPVQETEYEYFEVPETFFNGMGSVFPIAFGMYPGWVYAAYEDIPGGTPRKQLVEGLEMYLYTQTPTEKALIKVPKMYVAIKAKMQAETVIEGNTLEEWLENYAQAYSEPDVSTKCQAFYGYAITEDEFNQKLQELYDWYNG